MELMVTSLVYSCPSVLPRHVVDANFQGTRQQISLWSYINGVSQLFSCDRNKFISGGNRRNKKWGGETAIRYTFPLKIETANVPLQRGISISQECKWHVSSRIFLTCTFHPPRDINKVHWTKFKRTEYKYSLNSSFHIRNKFPISLESEMD